MGDHNKEILEQRDDLQDIASELGDLVGGNMDIGEQIGELGKELAEIYKLAGIELDMELSTSTQDLDWEDRLFIQQSDLNELEKNISTEINAGVKRFPKLSPLDWAVIGIAGTVASALDLLVVKIPKDTVYMKDHFQSGSKLTSWLRTLGVDNEGALNSDFLKWCEKVSKNPYDRSTHPDLRGIGFAPQTHRLHGLAHDPLFGIIFGLLDMINGSMTVLDKNGLVRVVKTFNPKTSQKVFAPLIWFAHIISDVCTSAGIPIPGWAFLQFAQFGKLGPKDRSVADISRWMYMNGYDLRHFLTMSIVPGAVEAIIMAYVLLMRLSKRPELDIPTSKATKELADIQQKLYLEKMRFFAHSIAVSGNALKICFSKGNPLAINFAEWVTFARKTVVMGVAVSRDTTPERIIRNSGVIGDKWEEIRKIPIGQIERSE
jgi:hypothetical protein